MELNQEQNFFAKVVQKAWEDADFKKALVENPLATIESFTGKKLNLPEGKTLVVRDQSDDSTVYINIPAAPEVNAELTEEQLEAVAGGCQWGDSGTGTILVWPPVIKDPIKDIILMS